MTKVSMPSRRRWPLRTVCRVNVPLRSRGTSRSSTPTSVASVFGGVAVAPVPAALAGRVTLLIAQMVGELRGKRPLHHRLRQRGEQPALPSDVQALLTGLSDQPVDQVRVDQPRLVPVPPHLPTPAVSSTSAAVISCPLQAARAAHG